MIIWTRPHGIDNTSGSVFVSRLCFKIYDRFREHKSDKTITYQQI